MRKSFNSLNIRILLFIIFATPCLLRELNAQTIYGATFWPIQGLWEVDVVGCTCDLTHIGNLQTTSGTTMVPEGGLALCPEGELYLSSFGELFSVDPASAVCTPVPGMPVIPNNLNGLACAGNGILYGIEENTGSLLFEYDLNANTVTLIGMIPFINAGGMFMYNSSLYLMGTGGLILVDTVNPENSTLVYSIPPGIYVNGATVYGDCNMVLLYTYEDEVGWSFRLLSLLDGSLISLCSSFFSYMFLTGTHEFNPTSCTLILDLDCDDSSGAVNADFNSPAFTCLTPNGVPIADEDAIIISDKQIEEMTIFLSSAFQPEGPDEFLDVAGPITSITVTGAGTDNITLINSGGATIGNFISALKQIVYRNNAPMFTEGQRIVEVQYTVDSGESCDIAIAYVDVIDLPDILVDLGPDLVQCEGEIAMFNAGNPGAMYLWSNNATTQIITTGLEGQYIVTVSNGIDCPDMDTVMLENLPNIDVALGADSFICDNESATITISNNAPFPITVELNISPGLPMTISGITGNYSFTDQPSGLTTYTIMDVIPSEPACLSVTDSIQVIEVFPTYYTQIDTSICDGDSVWLGTYWQTMAGVYGSTYLSTLGCDSAVVTTIHVLPQVMIFQEVDTCDLSSTGVFVLYLSNPNGCDTILFTTVHLFLSDTTWMTASTCIASEAGMLVMTEPGSDGCDSVIVTMINYLPPSDTTMVFMETCDSLSTVIFMDTILSSTGCDSLLHLNIVYSAPDTMYAFNTSCLPGDTGIFVSTYTNTLGCDSLIIESVALTPADTTYSFLTSCDSADIGIHEELFLTSLGCDSLQITTINFADKDSIFLVTTSCSAMDTGLIQNVYLNQFGCDSIVTQHILLAPSSSITLHSQSCNASDTGQFVTHYFNIYGCDSIVTNIISLSPSHDINYNSSSCHPADTGTFIQHYFNQFGCDSIVTSIVSFLAADTTLLSVKTCNPGEVGRIENMYISTEGCDSLVITETNLFPLPQLEVSVTSDFNGYDISCNGENDGKAIANIDGVGPFQYLWSTTHTEQIITGLSAGAYAVTVTDGNGCIAEGSVFLFDPPLFSISFVISQPDCFDQEHGSIRVEQTGGIEPIRYSIDGLTYQYENIFNDLSDGAYEVTAFDANDCEVKEIIWINVPVKVNVGLGDDQFLLAGDTAIIHAIVNIPYDSISSVVWTGLNDPDCPTCLTQTVSPIITTTFSITIQSIDGCEDQDAMTLFLLKDVDLYIPNIFSPNGDNINDRLVISTGPFIEKISSFSIYARWGNLVFSANNFDPGDPQYAWDGTFKGIQVNPGVFVFRLIMYDRNGKSLITHGNVTIVR